MFGFSEGVGQAVLEADGKVQHAKSNHCHKGTLRHAADSLPGMGWGRFGGVWRIRSFCYLIR